MIVIVKKSLLHQDFFITTFLLTLTNMKPLEISFVILTIVVFFTMNLCLFFARANKLESDTKVRVLRELRELKSEDLHRTDDETVEQAWRLFQQKASNWSHTFVDFVNPLAKKILNGTSVSRQCSQSLFHLLAAFGKLETWAVESKLRQCLLKHLNI